MEAFNELLRGDEGALKRALYKSMGHTSENLKKPLIAVVNSYTNATPGHYNLNAVAEHVKKGIEDAGGESFEFGTIAPCDGIAEGHEGMRYILASRDLIASSIECMTRAHGFDGIVVLGSCDKIVPGMLMATARLEMPSIFINGGAMYPASYKGKHYDGNIISEAIGWKKQGKITEQEFCEIEDLAEPTYGSCAMYGTANTMCAVAEALGMCLPNSSAVPAVAEDRLKMAYKTGEQIVKLTTSGITSKDIITTKSIENAIRFIMATGGSTNAILHLQAIYTDAGLGELPLEAFDDFSRSTPHIASIYPASEYDMVDYYEAGGVQAVLKELTPLLNLDVMTVSGQTMGENLSHAQQTPRPEVIRDIAHPFHKEGGICVLQGNIAPEGAIIKPAAVPDDMFYFKGKAKVYNSEDETVRSIMNGEIKPGTVVVIKYEGPKGGPGMPEMYKPMKYLEGMGLATSCALITDGRFSGSNRGVFAGHISPEAYEGSNFALIEDGDEICIDIDNRVLSADVSDEEFAKRRSQFTPIEKNIKRGYLTTYKRISTSASKGAIIK